MAAGPAADVLSWTPPPLPDPDGYGGLVLLDRWCYIADLTNATTAEGTTSGGLPIQVTFRVARPPLLSHFCIHCPGLDFTRADTKVVATDADLVLLCVPIRRPFCHWDYFVYRPLVRQLDLLPSPNRSFVDIATALLRLKGGSYAVASLVPRGPVCAGGVLIRREFDLHLYRSSSNNPDDKEEGLWITKRLSLNEFVRERVTPMPASREFGRMYHETDKTIAVSGSGEEGGGTVAWVDLWRGIFLCDVLKECPVLQDIPLPAPARGNWNSVLRYDDPRYFRDVTISRNRDSIKYVEMESCSPTELEDAIPVSYTEWMRKSPWKLQVTRDGWKATTWSMAIPVDSSSVDCWYRESQVHAKDITLDDSDPCIYELQSMLGCVGDAMKLWKELLMVYPSVSIDDNVVYLLTRTRPMDKLDMVFAIDLGKRVLRGVAKLDVQKNFIYRPICTSEILRFQRNTITGTTEEIGRTETKPLSQLQKKRVLRRARRTGKH